MIEFKKITEENFNECIKLEPKDDQKSFVAPNIRSLAQAYVALTNDECIPMPYAIYDNDVMVGFIMLSFNEAYDGDDADEEEKENSYWVWRFMIDKKYQGKGYGRQSMVKAIELIRSFPHGEATILYLSYELENVIAKALYASFGFVETGKIEDGEMLAKMAL